MALNPFFLQGSKGEQNLIQDLINEQIQIYGVEVHYLPRKFLTEKTVIREVIESMFDDAYPIEAYLENFDGYGDNTTILSKFGIQALNEISITISRERFETYITPLLKKETNVKLRHRPKEGDLIYFPLGDRLFEIKFVEHEQPFYQLQKTYTYTLKCELFRYEDEVIATGVGEIDDTLETGVSELGSGENDSLHGIPIGQIQKLTVVGVASTARATTTLVNGGIRFFTISNRGGGYSAAPRVAISSAPSGGVTGVGSATMISGIVVCNDNIDPGLQSIQSLEVINAGSGYIVPPKVAFFGGGGAGAAATATIGNGVVGTVNLINGGSGYTLPPTITFVGVSTYNVSAAATAIVSAAGTITQIRLVSAGLGYTVAPTISISSPNSTGTGDFEFNEVIIGSATSTMARVRSWNSITNLLEVSQVTGSFAIGEDIIGQVSGATHELRIINIDPIDDGYATNSEIENEADLIIDFSEKNPFGMP